MVAIETVQYLCPICHARYDIEVSRIGHRGECPKCHKPVVFIVPGHLLHSMPSTAPQPVARDPRLNYIRTSGLAIVALVFGLLTPLIGPFGSIPAIICGHLGRAECRRDSRVAGKGMALAGLTIGYLYKILIACLAFAAWLENRSHRY